MDTNNRKYGTRAERKAATRQRLIDAAKKVFAKSGYGGVRIRDIVARADTAIGTFYVHFPNKQILFKEIMRQSTNDLLELLSARAATQKDTISRVKVVYEQFLDYLADNWNLFVLLREGRDTGTEFAKILREVFDSLTVNLETLLERGMEKKEITNLNQMVLSRALVAMAVESIALLHEGKIKRSEVINTLEVLVFQGIRNNRDRPSPSRNKTVWQT
ncbi:MAG: TetR/AcrR family transcriptional regulator [Deltaproteobacteria bacterium]|nr:TetR/AcrR family transcriptional regulator [Deltaproteobacteria bacterium]